MPPFQCTSHAHKVKLMFVHAVCVHIMYVLSFFFFVDEQKWTKWNLIILYACVITFKLIIYRVHITINISVLNSGLLLSCFPTPSFTVCISHFYFINLPSYFIVCFDFDFIVWVSIILHCAMFIVVLVLLINFLIGCASMQVLCGPYLRGHGHEAVKSIRYIMCACS